MQVQKETLIFVVLALIAGFIGGFLLANSLNRSEMASLRSQSERTVTPNSNSSPAQESNELTANEIQAKIAESDKSPGNFEFQKKLGVALYRYSAMKQDPSLLVDAARILERANSLNGRDLEILVALGNARFDIGFNKKDTASLQAARDIYSKALEIKPNDADIRTDFGLTYFIQDPPAYDKAAAELQKVVEMDPKHKRSLQFLVRVQVKQGKLAEAEKTMAKLKGIDPDNEALPELESELSAARSGGTK